MKLIEEEMIETLITILKENHEVLAQDWLVDQIRNELQQLATAP